MIGIFGVLALGYSGYALWRRRAWSAVAALLAGAVLVGLELFARLHPEPAPVVALRLNSDEQAGLRLQLAQSELRAAGFAVPRTAAAGSGVVAVDGDFTARITQVDGAFRVERSGYPPLQGVTLREAVAKVLEAHTPKP